MSALRLSVNVDHVATLRNARGGSFPDPLDAARRALTAGADGITVHLREDRRHIRDDDLWRLRAEAGLRLNLEMAATREMFEIAALLRPDACCLVPERREERTTEGGLDVRSLDPRMLADVARLRAANIETAAFIEPESDAVCAAAAAGFAAVEFHTGRYADFTGPERAAELLRLQQAATLAATEGLRCHAGHGLDYSNVPSIASIAEIEEVSIGHSLIGAALVGGLADAVRRMRALLDAARIMNRQGHGS